MKSAFAVLLFAALPWTTIGNETAAWFKAHPHADAAQLAAAVNRLDPKLTTEALKLDRSTYVVSAKYETGGTFFVVGPDLKWSVKTVARQHYPSRDDIGKWAWTGSGWGDGPLLPYLAAARASRSGHPRFVVAADTATEAGGTYMQQISVWEWNGREAVPLFIKSYQRSFDTGGSDLTPDLVTLHTKGSFKTFYSCGSCVEPEMVWRIAITPDGVRDLGRTDVVPELRQFDELIDRIAHGKSTADIASPQVIATLHPIVGDGDLSLGMLGDWHVTKTAHGRVLNITSDALDVPWELVIEDRPDGPYFTKAGAQRQ